MIFVATGSWTSPSKFQISVQGNVGAKPPEIGHLTVMTLEAGNIRNRPPQSSATVGVYSPPLDGNFGPSSMRIIAFTAHDPLNSANEVRALGLFSVCATMLSSRFSCVDLNLPAYLFVPAVSCWSEHRCYHKRKTHVEKAASV